MDLIKVLSRTHINGNPLAKMMARTNDLALVDTDAFSQKDVVSAVFGADFAEAVCKGDVVNASREVGAMFTIWCKLFLKQKSEGTVRPFALTPGQSFAAPSVDCILSPSPTVGVVENAFIPNLDWFYALGKPARISNETKSRVMDLLTVRLRDALKNKTIGELLKANRRNVVITRYVAEALAEVCPTLTVLAHEWPSTKELPNLREVGISHFDSYNFCATGADAMYVAMKVSELMAQITSRAQITYEVGEYNGVQVMYVDFESYGAAGFRRIMIHPKDGVYEVSRMRRFGSVLAVNNDNKKMSLVSSYGTFIDYFMRFATAFICEPGNTKSIGKYYDKYLASDTRTQCPLTAVEDLGAVDGDRQHLEFMSAKVRAVGFKNDGREVVASFTPFGLVYEGEGKAQVVARSTSVMEQGCYVRKTFKSSDVDASAFEDFNLVRMISSNGAFVDGRRACLRMKHVPVEYRAEVIRAVEDLYLDGNSWIDHADGQFDSQTEAEEALVICLSSKVSKLIKRTAMDAAVVGRIRGGETRKSRLWGQKYESANNVMVPAVISQHLIGAAGNAYYWDEDLFWLENAKNFSENPEIDVITDGAGQPVIEVIAPGSVGVDKEDGWNVINFDGESSLIAGEEIVVFPYRLGNGEFEYAVRNRIDGALLSRVMYRMANNAGKNLTLNVKVEFVSEERAVKARNHVKAVVAPCPASVFENGLNQGLYAKALFPADTNKWGDLAKSKVDVVAATFIKNKNHASCLKGYDLVRSANELIGCSKYDDLIWAPLAGALGVYDELIAEFDRVFGRAVWTVWNDGVDGDWQQTLQRLYTYEGRPVDGWFKLDVEIDGFTDTVVLADGPVVDQRTNVFIFGTAANGSKMIMQRGYSFVGTEECPVYQPVKAELSSPIDNIGFSDTMAGVVRMIHAMDPETGVSLFKDGAKRVHKAAGLHMMAKGASINTVPCVVEGTTLTAEASAILRSDAVLEVFRNPNYKGRTFSALAEVLGDKFFTFHGPENVFSLNLAIVASQDANLNFASEESLSAVTEYLFRELVLNNKPSITDEAKSLMARVQSKLQNLVQSAGLNKACAFGAPVLGARSAGIPGIPVGEIWVPESSDPRSVYGNILSGFKSVFTDLGKISGVKMYGYRAPMTSPMVVKLVIIRSGDKRHKHLSPYFWNVNPIIPNIHGGDNDGDTNYFAPLVKKVGGVYVESKIPYTNLETVFDSIRVRTGHDQLACLDEYGVKAIYGGDKYYADHNEVKSFAAIQRKNGVSAKNLVLSHNRNPMDVTTMTQRLTRSTEMIKNAVGQTHTFVLQADIYACLAHELAEIDPTADGSADAWVNEEGIISKLYEIYEVPLGGLDDAAYDALFQLLIPLSKGGKLDAIEPNPVMNAEHWAGVLNDAGMCGKSYTSILDAAIAIGCVTETVVSRKKGVYPEEKKYSASTPNLIRCAELFLMAATYLSFRLSKGLVMPARTGDVLNRDAKLLIDVVDYIRKNDKLKEFARHSVVLLPILTFARYLAPAIQGRAVELDMDLFVNPGNDTGNDIDSDNEDGNGEGGSPAPQSPDPTPGPGTAPASEVEDVNNLEDKMTSSNFDNFRTWVNNLPARVKALEEWKVMSEDQLMAVFVICQGGYDCVTLTGRAGSGKSFVTKFAAKVLSMLSKDVYVTGTTGVATINAGGNSTINSLMQIKRGSEDFLPHGHNDRGNGRGKISVGMGAGNNFKPFGPEIVIFIDEISMASPENLVLTYQALYKSVGKNRPFRFVLVGDFRQLAPVSEGETKFAFENAEFNIKDTKKGDYTVRFGSFTQNGEGPFNKEGDRYKKDWKAISLSLLTNHRQASGDEKAGEFIEALNHLGEGCDFNDPKVAPIMQRVYVRSKDGNARHIFTKDLLPNTDAATHAFTANKHVAFHNEKIKNLAIQNGDCEVRNYKAKVVPNAWDKDQILKNVQPIEAEQQIYKGQKFMVRVNVPNSPLKNGTVGTVCSLQDKKIGLKLANGEVAYLEDTSFPLPETAEGSAGIFQTPAMGHGANGSTIWKLQGITIDNTSGGSMDESLVVNLKTRPFGKQHGLAYVFCSRVKSIEQLYIVVDDLNFLNKYVYCDPKVKSFIAETEETMRNLLNENLAFEKPKQKKLISVVKARKSKSSSNVGVIVSVEGMFYDVHLDENLIPVAFKKKTDDAYVDVSPENELKLELIEAALKGASEVI